MTELDRDRILALSYVPAARRAAVEALWRLDLALGSALAGGREPMISRIKLAWWRDTLEAIESDRPSSEPAVQGVARHVLPLGIGGAELARMEEGWAVLLSPEVLTESDLGTYAAGRGGRLFRLTARLLGGEGEDEAAAGGEAWALIDLARHCGNKEDEEAAVSAARLRLRRYRWPARLRPLGMLAVLAARDAETERPRWEEPGAPGRMLRMLRHRVSGK